MTPEQLDRLPALMREIVETDREIAALRREPVTLLLTYKSTRKRRAELRAAAERQWGHRLGGERNGNQA